MNQTSQAFRYLWMTEIPYLSIETSVREEEEKQNGYKQKRLLKHNAD
jgi:hypothetical protein